MASTTGLLYKTGVILADASEILSVRSLGFRPAKIVIANRTNQVMVEWFEGLPEGTNLKTVAAGTRTEVASAAAPADADADGNAGFTIPAGLADVNDADGEVLAWQAWGGVSPQGT